MVRAKAANKKDNTTLTDFILLCIVHFPRLDIQKSGSPIDENIFRVPRMGFSLRVGKNDRKGSGFTTLLWPSFSKDLSE